MRTQFDHFQLQDVLGSGGMGAVYRAFDQALNRFVALKLLRKEYSADPVFVEQFQREAAITASINHPNVVKVYSAGTDNGLVYIAMELVDKGSLDDLMTLQGRVAEMQVLEVGAQIARGLDAALRRGLIHRDVKPGNILFADAHSSKIVDFGLATLQHQAIKAGGEIWGTPYYVAPEKLDSPPVEDFRSDMYSLGATLFHALAGRPPFEAEDASMVALKHLKSQAVRIQAFAPDVSSATAFVINKTLSKSANDRYQSYEELAEHLDYAREELGKTAGSKQQRSRMVMESEGETKLMSWITFGMVAIVVLGGIGVWLKRDKFFGSKPEAKSDITTEESKKRIEELQPDFKAGRVMIVRSDFRSAARVLEQLETHPGVPQPLLSWVNLHQGLSLLLDGKEADARKSFNRLGARPAFGKTSEDQELSQFFNQVGKNLETDQPQPTSVAADLEKTTFRSIGLLLYALKDWHLGSVDDAANLFRQFRSATPEKPYEWIADYKTLADPYLKDYEVLQSAEKILKDAATPEKRKESLEPLRATKAELKLKSVLPDRIDGLAKDLEGLIAADEAKSQEKMAEIEKVDAPKLLETKKKCAALIGQYRFDDAKKAAEEAKVESNRYKNEQRALVAHMDSLAKFKAGLIKDLQAVNYTGQLVRRNKSSVPPGRITATEATMESGSTFGVVKVTWAEMAPDSVIAIAKAQIKPEPADAAADRQWRLGIYALTMGAKDAARELIGQAAQAKPEYAELKQLIESTIPGGI
ncbi:MAG TPA: protein kinase [Chthoniobacteraceae bacterium]|nr:protein kinase [Chthoniobacteraceae bacterium]